MVENIVIKKAQLGDQEALTEIFNKYEKFILLRSKSYFLNGADKDDLLQEGMIGLIKAIRAFDETRDASFNTFASLCIKRQIITAIKNYNSGKNRILNLATDGFYEGEESNIEYDAKSLNFYNPEEIYLGKEKLEGLKMYLRDNLSSLEHEVFEYMAAGIHYIDIAAKTGRDIKSIDNTIQRVKKKLKFYLDNYEHN